MYDDIITKILANGEGVDFDNYVRKYDNAGVAEVHVGYKGRSFYQWLITNRCHVKGSEMVIMNLYKAPVFVRKATQFGPIAEYLIEEAGLSAKSFKPVYTAWETYRKLKGEDAHETIEEDTAGSQQ